MAANRGSGLTQTAFAWRVGIKYCKFCSWINEPKKSEREPSAVRFTEVSLPVSAKCPGLEHRLPDGTELCGSDAAELAKPVRPLRS